MHKIFGGVRFCRLPTYLPAPHRPQHQNSFTQKCSLHRALDARVGIFRHRAAFWLKTQQKTLFWFFRSSFFALLFLHYKIFTNRNAQHHKTAAPTFSYPPYHHHLYRYIRCEGGRACVATLSFFSQAYEKKIDSQKKIAAAAELKIIKKCTAKINRWKNLDGYGSRIETLPRK